MRVVVVGAGLMGSQIGCEYALGGHEVVFVARRPDASTDRIDAAFAVAARAGIVPVDVIRAARGRAIVVADLDAVEGPVDLVVESVVEDLVPKIAVLRAAASRWPAATLASNTSALSITAMGDGSGAPERTIGTHYWNPPLLMPLVEVVKGERTADRTVEAMRATLSALGKRPVLVENDVPGFIWNRLQLALLREAIWLVEHGVATPATVDEVVRDGLARRWRLTGPFETVALGGPDTFSRIAAHLFPLLSDARDVVDLRRWLDQSPEILDATRRRRDAGLIEELARERGNAAVHGPTDDGDDGR